MSDENFMDQSQILLYQTEDGRQRIEVRLEQGTVWLSQTLLAELFQTTVANVNLHIRNIYAEKEVSTEGTIKQYLIVRKEGSRKVQRTVIYYNSEYAKFEEQRIKEELIHSEEELREALNRVMIHRESAERK